MTIRAQIVDAADDLFYRQGFAFTSFAHIADAVQISRGNFYYHFKSKDEILDAVIVARRERTAQMLAQWEAGGEGPQARIRSFIEILLRNQAPIMRHGCPVGTLCMELAKLEHAGREKAASLFTLFREWLARQFVALGHAADRADALALHLLGRSQGVATLANSFHDPAYVEREVAALCEWLQAVAEQGRQASASSPAPRPRAATRRTPRAER